MIKKNYEEVESQPVTLENTKDAYVRWLIDEKDVAKYYAMRRFEVKPEGKIPLHDHPEDHEIYILEGTAKFYNNAGKEEIVNPGDVLYIPPDEKHGIDNLGRNDLGRICRKGSVHVTEFMEIERYTHVMHIVSNVEGRLRKDKDQYDVLSATFPHRLCSI